MPIDDLNLSSTFVNELLGPRVCRAQLFRTDLRYIALRLDFWCDHQAWQQIQSQALFNTDAETFGPIFGGGFSESKDYHITIELSPDFTTDLSIMLGPAELFSNRMTSGEVRDAAAALSWDYESLQTLLESRADFFTAQHASWNLVQVAQQVTPKTEWGMTTTHYRDLNP